MNKITNNIPIHPTPIKDYPNSLKLLLMARKDLLSIWPEFAYETDFFGSKIINQWMFIANSPSAVEHVFVKKNSIYERKSAFMRKALEPLLGDGLFVSEGKTWKKHRNLESPSFKTENIRYFSEVMVSCASERAEFWAEYYIDKEIPVLTEMASLTAEILSKCLFGNDLGHQNAEKIVYGFHEYQAGIEQFDLTSFFGFPNWFPKIPQSKKIFRMAKNIHDIVDKIIEVHLNYKQPRTTLLSMLLDNYDPNDPESITLEQIRNEAVVLLMAGHETTANSLAWTWYLLSLKPEVREKFHTELDEVLGQRLPTYDDISSLVYTRAIFEEAMRLYPPVPTLSRESLEDDIYDNTEIPKGSVMVVVPWLLHRQKNYWKQPNEFIPERFLNDWAYKHEKYAYVPFSAGPRFCLGAAFGLTEAILCLATLAQKMTLQINKDKPVDYECRLTLRPKNKLPMILHLRN